MKVGSCHLTDHVLKRMSERCIKKSDIEDCLKTGELFKTFKGFKVKKDGLVVVLNKGRDIVLTVYGG